MIGTFLLLRFFEVRTVEIPIEVIENPKPTTLQIQSPQPVTPVKPEIAKPKVFGISKKTAVVESTADTVGVKTGNTVAVAPDDLKSDGEESLPIPADEFLVSRMPKIKNEFRVPYPLEAKQKNIEGPVVTEILIDDTGRVREVKLVSGPGFGLNEAAVAAIRQFTFEPAQAGDKLVAVRIRYTYRFVLEK